jgi:hypothetical protein
VPDAPARARREPSRDWILYLLAAITYIAAGIYEKFFLNWVMGPIWLVAWVSLVPAIGRRLRTRRAQ